MRRFIRVLILHKWPWIMAGLLAASLTEAHGEQPTNLPNTSQIRDFALLDTLGVQHSIATWQDKKAVVLFFLGTECPVSNGYAPDMQRLASAYAKQGVGCYGVYCEQKLDADRAARHGKEYGLDFPLLLDPAQALAKAVGARVTPEAVVASPRGEVFYLGRIDDRYSTDGKRRDEPTSLDLENALRATLAGKRPAVSRTSAFGCPLPRVR